MAGQRMTEKVQQCEAIVGYTFNDPHLCWEALQVAGSGVTWTGVRHIGTDGNKRLAILGDFVIAVALSRDWYPNGGSKAQWDAVRQLVLSNENLHAVGRTSGLDRCINTNPSNPVTLTTKVVAPAVEAIVGAISQDGPDGNMAAVQQVMQTLGLSWAANSTAVVTFTPTPFLYV